MVRARFFRLLVLFALLAALAVPVPVIAQEPEPLRPSTAVPVMQSVTVAEPQVISAMGGSWFGSNLIINGDAEVNGPGRPTSGWTGGTNDFIVASSYGDPGYPLPNDPGPMDRGARFFRGSQNASEINAWQTRDIAHLSALVDTGQVGYDMRGFFGGLGASNDYAVLRVYFDDGTGKQVPGAPPKAIGFVNASARLNQTGLLERSTHGYLPKGTRKLTFQLQMMKGGASNPNALADSLSLVLEQPKVMLPLVVRGGTTQQPTRIVPAAPTNLFVYGNSLTTIQLSWNDNAANETGYFIERATAGSSAFTPLAYTEQNATTYSDDGLAPQTSYTYRVSAYNEAGSSPAVTANGATLSNPVTPPTAPASCWTSDTGATTTVVGWSDSSNNEAYFILEMGYAGGVWQHLSYIEPGATYVIVTDIIPNSNFYFRIAAGNAAGDSAWCTTPQAHTTALSGIFIVENQASHPIVYLAVDGVNQFPVYPMGILPTGSYEMSLSPGRHTIEARTGFWEDRFNRFDMYTIIYEIDLASGYTSETLVVPDMPLEDILTQFDPSGEGYWEGYFFDANIICHTAAFRFYADGTYKFYVGNSQQATGSYSEVQRMPEIFGLKFSVPGYEALLLEPYGQFDMNNGPAGWQQITYNYKPQGYVYNPFCP